MNIKELQQWLNDHGATPKLTVDGLAGTLTRAALIQVFVNKDAKAITEAELKAISDTLGDTSGKRIKAVAKVEGGNSGWFTSGLPKILYERHYFYRFTKGLFKIDSWFNSPESGNYTEDINKNGINDSWEKLATAACKDPDSAFKSISIGKFQVMGKYYSQCGYKHPIDMLWAARNSELAHYQMLVNYILKVANLKEAFLRISTNPKDCIDFAKGYNGSGYKKYKYDSQIAAAMLKV